jgi:hypothetical protein
MQNAFGLHCWSHAYCVYEVARQTTMVIRRPVRPSLALANLLQKNGFCIKEREERGTARVPAACRIPSHMHPAVGLEDRSRRGIRDSIAQCGGLMNLQRGTTLVV